MTLDDWLSKMYQARMKHKIASATAEFKTALAADPVLTQAASDRLKELNALVEARGEMACAYSTSYRGFLQEVLG